MKIETFKEMLNNNNCIQIVRGIFLFNDFELYDSNENISRQLKTFENALKYHIGNDTIMDIVLRTDRFKLEYSGGRGADSPEGPMGGGFGHASDHGSGHGKVLFPATFNRQGRFANESEALRMFSSRYKDADHEYGITVDSQGFVHSHIEGGSSSVSISGAKGERVLHNHPSGGNFSDSDLISTASTMESGIDAIGSKETFRFTKKKNFNAKGFIKGVKTAKWPVKYNYDDGADWWLKRNAKKYGFKYERIKTIS